MTLIDSLFTIQTATGALLVIIAWIVARAIDYLLERFFERKVFATVAIGIKWRVRALLTKFQPLSATFQMSYTPESNTTVTEAKSELRQSFEKCEEKSKDRITCPEISWNSSGEGKVKVQHMDSDDPFDIQIKLVDSVSDLAERPDIAPQDRYIGKISFEIEFHFAYRELGDVISNLNTFVTLLRDSLDEVIDGSISRGQFVIRPLNGKLTLEEWIRSEGFEVSLLLNDEDENKTQVEFLGDRAEIRPPYLQMDSEVRRYLEILILDYYLKNKPKVSISE